MADSNNQGDASAHPATPNFDQVYAQEVMGDLAEEVRKHFVDKFSARSPGLQTQAQPDGSLTVVADNPEVGVGIQVQISLIQAAPQQGVGVGPQPAFPQVQPGMPQPGVGMGPQQAPMAQPVPAPQAPAPTPPAGQF